MNAPLLLQGLATQFGFTINTFNLQPNIPMMKGFSIDVARLGTSQFKMLFFKKI